LHCRTLAEHGTDVPVYACRRQVSFVTVSSNRVEENIVLQTLLRCSVMALCCLLTSCAQPVRQSEQPGAIETSPPSDKRGAAVYTIEAESSELHILVYRGGTLARLGHNHVLSSKALSGEAWLHPEFTRSGFQIALPVESLIIDDAQARAVHGEPFAAPVPQKDIDGTRRNLMKPEVLDGQRFPEIRIASSRIAGTLEAPRVMARVTIKDITRELAIPMSLTRTGTQLEARGQFDIQQSEFGMTPFSIALGALQVQDRLHVTFRVVATANQ
jgi:polyisoprenoid-binding protein YceI